jgi:hypothetical protein
MTENTSTTNYTPTELPPQIKQLRTILADVLNKFRAGLDQHPLMRETLLPDLKKKVAYLIAEGLRTEQGLSIHVAPRLIAKYSNATYREFMQKNCPNGSFPVEAQIGGTGYFIWTKLEAFLSRGLTYLDFTEADSTSLNEITRLLPEDEIVGKKFQHKGAHCWQLAVSSVRGAVPADLALKLIKLFRGLEQQAKVGQSICFKLHQDMPNSLPYCYGFFSTETVLDKCIPKQPEGYVIQVHVRYANTTYQFLLHQAQFDENKLTEESLHLVDIV